MACLSRLLRDSLTNMRFDILTLFPDMVSTVLGESIIGRAQEAGYISVGCHNIRDFSTDKHRKTDDTPYGGGVGMVMSCQPIYDCYESIKSKIPEGNKTRVIYMSPKGRIFSHSVAKELSEYDNLVFLCGHYEGVDQRIIDEIVDDEISIGDYVLTNGTLPAAVIADATARYVKGVLGEENSLTYDSFNDNLLAFPQYTRPADFRGMKVPEVLMSGDHKKIAEWRREQQIIKTKERRQDILK